MELVKMEIGSEQREELHIVKHLKKCSASKMIKK